MNGDKINGSNLYDEFLRIMYCKHGAIGSTYCTISALCGSDLQGSAKYADVSRAGELSETVSTLVRRGHDYENACILLDTLLDYWCQLSVDGEFKQVPQEILFSTFGAHYPGERPGYRK